MASNGRRSTPLFLDFAPDAPLEDVLAAVEAIYKSTGCGPCGRLSFLIKAEEVVDPAIGELREIGSLRSVLPLGQQTSIATAAQR